jgi:putative tricarboxylic transport membrane protein
MLRDHMDLIYALLFGIVISQLFTSGLGLLTTPLLARLSVLPSRWIAPFVLVLVFVGTYMVRANIFDVAMAVFAGIFGYLLRRYGFPLITVVIGYILGPLAERSYIQSMQISDDSLMIFLTEPISAILMFGTVFTLAVPIVAALRSKRRATP